MSIKTSLSLAVAFVGAAGAFALAQGDARERLRRQVGAQSCEAAALISALAQRCLALRQRCEGP